MSVCAHISESQRNICSPQHSWDVMSPAFNMLSTHSLPTDGQTLSTSLLALQRAHTQTQTHTHATVQIRICIDTYNCARVVGLFYMFGILYRNIISLAAHGTFPLSSYHNTVASLRTYMEKQRALRQKTCSKSKGKHAHFNFGSFIFT